jgi:hypothetical protein
MLNYGNSEIKVASLNLAGNRNLNEGATFAESPLVLNEYTNKGLADFLMTPFKKEYEEYRFERESLIAPIVAEIFAKSGEMEDGAAFSKFFHEQSQEITDLVYEAGDHPHIHRGEVMVAYVTGLVFGDCFCDGICIVKFEQKENFLFTDVIDEQAKFSLKNGSRNTKIGNAFLVLNMQDSDGYHSFVIDGSKGDLAYFWKERTLGVSPKNDKHYQTKKLLSVYRDFVVDEIPEQFEISKTEQSDLLQRSFNYLQSQEEFNMDDFAELVISQPEVKEAFKSFVNQEAIANDYIIPPTFEISSQALKDSKSLFSKQVIKLDKNFKIDILKSGGEMIERGFDEETNRYFYKLYFREEN